MITITNGPKNTLKSLLSSLHFKTLPPKIANNFVNFFAGAIPFNLKSLRVSKVHISHAKQYCGNCQLCIKWRISVKAQK